MSKPNGPDSFWSLVIKSETCWEWSRPVDEKSRYPKLRIGGGRRAKAHRYAWEITNGPIPEGLHVLHKCDNTRCVRPDHLFLGTHADNMADKASKGRVVAYAGEKNANARLTDELVRAIRERYSNGETQVSIAADLHMHQPNVSRIVLRKAWRHV